MIESSDRLIIHQLENVSIPALEGKIIGMSKRDSIVKQNTKLQINSLEGDIKRHKASKVWWGVGGYVLGILSTIVAILLL